MPELAYAHLNLRRNPFGELEPDEWARVAVVDTAPILALLDEGVAVQLVGDQGRGKTTHLLALAEALDDATWYRADTDGPGLPAPCTVLLLDEADQVSWLRRRALLQRAPRAVLATHVDLSLGLRLAGWTPHRIPVGGIELDHLDALVRRRIDAARRGPGPLPRVPRDTLRALVARHGDDLRAITGSLYERFQRLPDIRDVVV